MKRIVTLFLSLVLLLSCLCAPASALFDPSLFYEVQARSAYVVNTDTNIIVYDKDSSRQVPAGGLTKYMTIALLLTNYADQLDNTFQMPFAISDYVYNTNNADMRSNETFTYREAMYAMLTRNANEAAMGVAYTLAGGDLDGCDVLPDGMHGLRDYALLETNFENWGFGEQIVRNLFYQSLEKVVKLCIM